MTRNKLSAMRCQKKNGIIKDKKTIVTNLQKKRSLAIRKRKRNVVISKRKRKNNHAYVYALVINMEILKNLVNMRETLKKIW
jgi:hypothetical protein